MSEKPQDAKEALKAEADNKEFAPQCHVCRNFVAVKRLTALIKADAELVAEGREPTSYADLHRILVREKTGVINSRKAFTSGHMARWRDGISTCGKAHV